MKLYNIIKNDVAAIFFWGGINPFIPPPCLRPWYVAKVYLQTFQSVQNMAARMVFGVRRSEHITPVLEGLHWLPVSQRVVFKTALMVWKCVHGVASAYLSDLCVPATAISGRQHLRSAAHFTGSTRPNCNWTTKFHSQRTSHMEPSATSTTVTGPVGERPQAGTEDASVLNRPEPLRRFHDFGARYNIQTCLLTCRQSITS